ncbi:MAG: adenylate kinase family protein [Candidatus Limnocylindrales bacterium]
MLRLYVMLGAPGAGKGTQATILARLLGIPHVASGELFRAAVRDRTPLGLQAAADMERGALVSDELVIRLVLDRLAQPDTAEGAILDGFPRTRPQAEALDAELATHGAKVSGALYVEVHEEELLRRLSGRWLCRESGHSYHVVDHPPKHAGICDFDGSELYQRDDDRPATVRVRLDRQLAPMYEVVDHYRGCGMLSAVNGEQPIEAVTEALLRAIAQPAH